MFFYQHCVQPEDPDNNNQVSCDQDDQLGMSFSRTNFRPASRCKIQSINKLIEEMWHSYDDVFSVLNF